MCRVVDLSDGALSRDDWGGLGAMRAWPIRLQDLRCGFCTRRTKARYELRVSTRVHLTQVVSRYGRVLFMHAFHVRKVLIANE